ncbi:hypothetical protein E2C01_035652 [Portunus trituberculatus]|uniref:Uncharacterized protein n=1 Tax=Portunus trituberculatus TaxID=210409 RepID=A0A5B7FAB6_PORTR|nr:hypothetical protein [Portunus trituberculatus]
MASHSESYSGRVSICYSIRVEYVPGVPAREAWGTEKLEDVFTISRSGAPPDLRLVGSVCVVPHSRLRSCSRCGPVPILSPAGGSAPFLCWLFIA